MGPTPSAAHLGLLAELAVSEPGPESSLRSIDRGLAIADETGEHFTDPYLHRLRGELLLKRNPSEPTPAEEAFKAAIAVAKVQGARSYELLASLSLAKLYRSTGRPADAHAVLTPALEGFAPTPEMPEIAEAKASLGALAETEEVKRITSAVAANNAVTGAYSCALIAARGAGAPETMRLCQERASPRLATTRSVTLPQTTVSGGQLRARRPSFR